MTSLSRVEIKGLPILEERKIFGTYCVSCLLFGDGDQIVNFRN